MTNKNNRITQKICDLILRQRGRPKGNRYYPVTFTLTVEQIDFLNTQPNASELVRKVLDDLILHGKILRAIRLVSSNFDQ